jgi:hypothetical protein
MALFKPLRTMGPEPGKVLFAMPFGHKTLSNGAPFDFDAFYTDVCVPTVRDCGMEPVRVDGIYGSQGVLETVWRAMQQAHIVVVDLTARSVNVSFELGWGLLLGKRIIVLTQDPDDIPTDVKGRYRHIPYSPMYADMQRMRNELVLELKALSETPAEEMAPMPSPGVAAARCPPVAGLGPGRTPWSISRSTLARVVSRCRPWATRTQAARLSPSQKQPDQHVHAAQVVVAERPHCAPAAIWAPGSSVYGRRRPTLAICNQLALVP